MNSKKVKMYLTADGFSIPDTSIHEVVLSAYIEVRIDSTFGGEDEITILDWSAISFSNKDSYLPTEIGKVLDYVDSNEYAVIEKIVIDNIDDILLFDSKDTDS